MGTGFSIVAWSYTYNRCFWFGASSANTRIDMTVILSPSVMTSKLIVAELRDLEASGWLLFVQCASVFQGEND